MLYFCLLLLLKRLFLLNNYTCGINCIIIVNYMYNMRIYSILAESGFIKITVNSEIT